MNSSASPEKAQHVRAMFARIVPRYDMVNRVMTFGLDRQWRRIAVTMANPVGGRALDVATGTADLAIELVKGGAKEVVAIDFCLEMLKAARQKIDKTARNIKLLSADALRLPFHDDTFDCVVNAFLLRNLADIPAAFKEFLRVLRPGGRLVCLDLTPPQTYLKPLINFYLDLVVPLIGQVIARDAAAYRYLASSLKFHPDGATIKELLSQAGFVQTEVRLLGFGAIALHRGHKPHT